MPAGSPFDHVAAHRVRAVYSSWRSQPGWVHKIVAGVVFMILLGLAAFLLVWGLVVAAIILAISAVIVGVRALMRYFTGEDSMRRNVRIVRRP